MLLKVEHLRVAFRTEKGLSVPVRDVSFEVPENGRVALVGESGCGKSVTSLAVGGLVDRAEIGGSVGGIAANLLAGRVISAAGYVPVFSVIAFCHLTAFLVLKVTRNVRVRDRQ